MDNQAMEPIFLVDISSTLSDNVRYLRNNKAEGEKNVRCFPQCNSNGHCASGFCGSSIKAILSITRAGNCKEILKSLIIVGELMPSDSQPTILEESVYTESLLNRPATYSKFYKAEMSLSKDGSDGSDGSDANDHANLEFNTNPKSWGYSYVAHRFKKESKHQFVISVLIVNHSVHGSENSYKCVGTFRSAEFQIQCKRRAHIQAGSMRYSQQCNQRSKRKETARPKTIKVIRAASATKLDYDQNIPQPLPITTYPTFTNEVTMEATNSSSSSRFRSVATTPHREPFTPFFSPANVVEFSPNLKGMSTYNSPTNANTISRDEAGESYDNMIAADMSHRSYESSPWPLGVGPHPFNTSSGADCWTPIIDGENLRASPCLSTGRIALLQQLFANDISVFCCK